MKDKFSEESENQRNIGEYWIVFSTDKNCTEKVQSPLLIGLVNFFITVVAVNFSTSKRTI